MGKQCIKGQMVNNLGFAGHMISVTYLFLKRPHGQMGMTGFQKIFIYEH